MIRKVVGHLQNREVAFSTVTPVERKKSSRVFFIIHHPSKTKIGKKDADKGRQKATGRSRQRKSVKRSDGT